MEVYALLDCTVLWCILWRRRAMGHVCQQKAHEDSMDCSGVYALRSHTRCHISHGCWSNVSSFVILLSSFELTESISVAAIYGSGSFAMSTWIPMCAGVSQILFNVVTAYSLMSGIL